MPVNRIYIRPLTFPVVEDIKVSFSSRFLSFYRYVLEAKPNNAGTNPSEEAVEDLKKLLENFVFMSCVTAKSLPEKE